MDNLVSVLHEADQVLNSCGRPVPPAGYTWVDIPGHLYYTRNLPPGTNLNLDRVGNPSPTVFLMRGFSGVGPPGVAVQFKLPTGRFIQSNFSTDFGTNNGTGSYRGVFDPEFLIPPRETIQVGLNSTIGGELFLSLVKICFHGVFRWLLTSDGKYVPYNPKLSMIPRVVAGSNQNIMVPEWFVGNGQCGMEIPDGYRAEPFSLFSDPIVTPLAGPPVTNFPVIVPRDGDFIPYYLNIDFVQDGGVLGGTSTVAIRLPDGRSLSNGDLLDWDAFSGPIFPQPLLRAGTRILIDTAIRNPSGAGNITITPQFDGWKLVRA